MSVKFQNLLATFAMVIAAMLIAVGCGGDEGPGGGDDAQLAAEQELVANMGKEAEPGLFNPAGMSSLDAINTKGFVQFAGLYRIEGEDNEIVPHLAKGAPEISEDGLTYTIEMRDDAEWSDGKPITAEDVVTAVRWSLDPENGAYFATFLSSVVGACELLAGDDKKALEGCPEPRTDGSPEQVGVRATDEHTVEIKLNRPVPWLEQMLTIQVFYPLRADQLEELGKDYGKDKRTAVSGPFKLESYKPGSEIVYTKNDKYFQADDVELETLRFRMIGEPNTAAREFERGRLHTGLQNTMFDAAEVDKWKGDDRFVTSETVASQYMYMNTQAEALSDPKVRQGIAMAINRKDIVENIRKLGDEPLNHIPPPAVPGSEVWSEGNEDFLSEDGEPDVEKARELLEEGGWDESQTLSIYYASDSGNAQAIAEQIQANLQEVGVKTDLKATPSDNFFTEGVAISPTRDNVHLVLVGWIQDYLEAQNWYQLFYGPNVDQGLNTSNYRSDEYNEIYEEALETTDNDARYELYKQLEAKLTGPDGDMPAAPLYTQTDATLVADTVEGFELLPSGIIYWENVAITEEE